MEIKELMQKTKAAAMEFFGRPVAGPKTAENVCRTIEGFDAAEFMRGIDLVRAAMADDQPKDPGPPQWSPGLGGSLKVIGKVILQNQRDNGFKGIGLDDYHHSKKRIPAALMLVVSECAEALECFRDGDNKEDFAEELADIVIRVVGISAGLGIDLGFAINRKINININQPRKYERGCDPWD